MSHKVMNCPHCGKILPGEFWHEENKADKLIVKCPRCKSDRTRKYSKQYTASGITQRYYCANCGRTFSRL